MALAAVYFTLARIGPALTPMRGFATLVWPASGAALAALVLGGYRLWPGIALGAVMTEIALEAPPLVALGIIAGNTLEAVAGTFVLRRIPGFNSSLDRLTDVLGLAVLAGMASSVIGATVGTLFLTLGHHETAPFLRSWLVWWSGDLLGILIIAPLILTWARRPGPPLRPGNLARGAALGAVLLGSSAFLFFQPPEATWTHIFQPHLLIIPLLWVTLRHGVRGAATGTFLMAIPAVWGTYTGHGAFAHADLLERLGALNVFLFSGALASLLLGAVVAEQARSRESLRESEERQRLAIEAAHLGMWYWDQRSGDLVWTPKCRSMHGLGPDEQVTFERFLATLHPDDRPRIQGAIRRSIERREDYRIEYRVIWPDASVHWISVLGRVFYDESGEPARMLGVALDVTAEKQAEQERAVLLQGEQAARADAQAATRAKDEFLAVVSHELRAPLQSMLGWTQILLSRHLEDRTLQKGLETIDRNAKLQAQLIEDLLDVSRIVAGKLRVERVRVDLAEVVAAALESATAAADAKSIHLQATTENMLGEVLGDPARLQQIVSNLLSNAVKFTPPGGHVRVRIARGGLEARIVVADDGAGIAPDFLPHVFDRFRQAESTLRRSHGGLGLGLSIVRHLVELHRGTVKAESPGEGKGATFTVTLPLISAAGHAITADRRRATKRAPVPRAALQGVRVLVVDDDPDAREVLETALHESGVDVHAVHSVRAALDELESFRPDLILSDIGMPEEDGYALIRQVRARESAAGGHTPAVALTAFASQSDREQALALGFEEHLAKPTSPSELARTVARLVGHAR